MELPFISIIIPAYNSGRHIGKAIDSIVQQSYKNIEIVIIDGGSRDNTLEIVKSYDLPKARIISERDEGIYDAINKGISVAKGEWVYVLGSDDFLYSPETLSVVASHLLNTTADFVYGEVMMGDRIYAGKFDTTKILSMNICQQAIFYKASLFHEYGHFDKKYRMYADYVFNLRMFSKKNVRLEYVEVIVACYGQDGFSSRNIDVDFSRDYPKIVAPLLGSHQEKMVASKCIGYAGLNLFQKGERWIGFIYIMRSVLDTKSLAPLASLVKFMLR